jgi:hypothetical protein
MAREQSPRRSAAEELLKKMGGGGAPPMEDEEMAPPPMPEEGMPPMPEEGGEMMPPPEGGGGEMDLDSALAGVEAAMSGLPEDAAKEVRMHLEAIRSIAAGGGEMPPEGGMPEESPIAPDSIPPQAPDGGMENMPV